MNPLGVHALIFVSGWSQEEAARAVRHAAECGYDYLEIPLIDPTAINIRRTRKALEKAKVKPMASLALGQNTDISSDDPTAVKRGEDLLLDALSAARDLGSSMLCGVLYSALGRYRTTPTEAGRWNSVNVLRRLAEKAKASNMTLGIEPVNRYESNLVNTGDDALKLIDTVGADNMVVHLDSYHMNIEEGEVGPMVERLGERLGYVHVNESHRGYLGTGSVDFAALFRALADHGYDGPVTFEAFSAGAGDPGLNAEHAVWRSLYDDPEDLARHARNFMMQRIQEAVEAKAAEPDAAFDDPEPPIEERPRLQRPPPAFSEDRPFGFSRR